VAASGNVSISSAYYFKEIASIVTVTGNTTSVNVTAQRLRAGRQGNLYTARYATLSIWGSWYNQSFTRQNMSGDGASVAEWAVIVEDPPSGYPEGVEAPVSKVKRQANLGLWGKEEMERGAEMERSSGPRKGMLGLVGRYTDEWEKRRKAIRGILS
jgi:hypothetical protein